MKKLFLALAALAMIPTQAQAYQHSHSHWGWSLEVYTGPVQPRYGMGYYGRIWTDPYGYVRCVRPNGHTGYLMDRYSRLVTRWNFQQLYYGTYNPRLRCR